MNNETMSTKSTIVFSIVLILCGMLLLIYPFMSFVAIYLLLGVAALIRGVILIISFFRTKGTNAPGRSAALLLGVILTLLGFGFFFAPAFITGMFAYIMAFWFILDGVSGLFRRKEMKAQGGGAATFYLVLSIFVLLGGIVLLFNPFIISVAIPVIIGFNAIMLGISAIMTANALKKAA